jgi:hypothetical protein
MTLCVEGEGEVYVQCSAVQCSAVPGPVPVPGCLVMAGRTSSSSGHFGCANDRQSRDCLQLFTAPVDASQLPSSLASQLPLCSDTTKAMS